MARFHQPPDPRFWRLNRSVAFDRRLAPFDLQQSRAHLRALGRLEVATEDEVDRLDRSLAEIATEFERDEFAFDAADEDVHMAIERRLGELAGPVAGKLHTGRSRNDQVATDIAMAVRHHADRAIELLGEAMAGLVELAERHRDWPMPGYTHLQRAQPVYLGHHLLAYFWMLSRDVERFAHARRTAKVMPLGSGALAGVNWEIDRRAVAEELGFTGVTPNSLDGASNRDFVLDYLSAASVCATHLSRLGSEIVIWSSAEFGFCALAEPFSSGSSIMPQKMNPDSAELLRAKAPRVVGDLTTLLGILHALPLTYGKDMQEDKEPFFDAVDTVEACLAMTAGMLEGITFDRERLAAAAGDEMLAATEIADHLVSRGVPFREAHGIVGELVREALAGDGRLSAIEPERLAEHSEHLEAEEFRGLLQAINSIESKRIEGGTSSESLEIQLRAAHDLLEAGPAGDR